MLRSDWSTFYTEVDYYYDDFLKAAADCHEFKEEGEDADALTEGINFDDRWDTGNAEDSQVR